MNAAEIAEDAMKAYCDVAPDGHPGTDEPWTWAADKLAETREAVRRAFWMYLPDAERAAMSARLDEEAAAHRAQRLSDERAKRDREAATSGWAS